MRYAVKARPTPFGSFRRSGIRFECAGETILTEDQITDAIRDEPMLIVREVEDSDTEIDTDEPKPIGQWTVAELKAFAAESEIDLGAAKTKADIIAAINTALDTLAR